MPVVWAEEEAVSRLVPIKIGDMEVWMEADDAVIVEAGTKKAGRGEPADEAGGSAETMSRTVKAYCSVLMNSIKELPDVIMPRMVRAEFGLKLSPEGKVFVAKSSGEASIKITVEWQAK